MKSNSSKKTTSLKSAADNFYEMLRDNPAGIIEFCENEIREYKRLILLIKAGQKLNKKLIKKGIKK